MASLIVSCYEDPQAKKPVSTFLNSSNLVKISVGPDRTPFFVHEDLLCNRIDYFRAAFKGSFKEAQEKQIDLLKDDPVPFAELINWVYGQKIECKGSACKVARDDGVAEDCPIQDIFAVCILADKYGADGLVTMCIESCRACLTKPSWKGWTLSREEVDYIYRNTLASSRLRAWAIEQMVEFVFREQRIRKLESWIDIRECTDATEEKFHEDCKKAVRHHMSRVGPNECNIPECLYHDRSDFEFVFNTE